MGRQCSAENSRKNQSMVNGVLKNSPLTVVRRKRNLSAVKVKRLLNLFRYLIQRVIRQFANEDPKLVVLATLEV